jgi:hypothetical protein
MDRDKLKIVFNRTRVLILAVCLTFAITVIAGFSSKFGGAVLFRPVLARPNLEANKPDAVTVAGDERLNNKKEKDISDRRNSAPPDAEANRIAQNGPTVKPEMTFYGESPALSYLATLDLPHVSKENGPLQENEMEHLVQLPEPSGTPGISVRPFKQSETLSEFAPLPGISFEGPGMGMPGYQVQSVPPDPTMAVGPNHIVAWVNSQIGVFTKNGITLLPGNGTIDGNVLWVGLGNVCETTNRGDPIVQYDRMADRWILSQFAFDMNGSGQAIAPYLQCFAVSSTNDPTGTYYRYAALFSPTSPSGFNDYGKIGVWPDAYYTSYNMFGGTPAGNNTGAALCASDRTKMLAGQPASTLCAPIAFYAGGVGFLPADLDGPTPPTNTSQGGIFARTNGTSLRLMKLKPDFAAGTVTLTDGLGGGVGSFVDIPVGDTTIACNGNAGPCIAQPGTTTLLDTLADRLMYRLAYRNRNGVDSLVVTHSVDPDGAGPRSSAARWYEIRSPFATTPTLYQNSTFDPGGSGDRWMGSIAMDKDGNMMLGYSIANAGAGLKASIAVTGRFASDPLNVMQTETIAVTGTGSQTISGGNPVTRWGDYTTVQVDPADDATFWYINQYMATDGVFNWRTRISSFKFGSGTPTPTPPPGACDQNFDAVTAPALPSGWTSAATGAETAWVTSIVIPDTAPNVAFAPDPSGVGNTELISSPFLISAGGGSFSFRNFYSTENTFDGMVLEISINGGAYQDILAAGGSFAAGGYNGTISTSFMSPIAGRQAWTGSSGGYITTTVNLPSAANGQNIRLKWRMASDQTVEGVGVRIDTIAGIPCFTVTPTPTATLPPTNTPTYTPTATPTNTPTATPTAPPLTRAGFDYDGDHRTDISVFRPSSGAWYLQRSTAGLYGTEFGYGSDRITPADYDGDGKTDIAVYRPSTGLWYINKSTDGTVDYRVFGIAEDLPAPADYDGDGKADIAVFRPSTATWYRQNSHDGSFYAIQFGIPEDRPTIGDFDADGRSDIAIFRPSLGDWYQLYSSDSSLHGAEFGFASDVIVPADYDGDRRTDIAVFRPSTGLWYIAASSTSQVIYAVFGLAADIPAPGDFDGDGKADISVFRPSDGNWYRRNSSDGSFAAYQFGMNGDRPTQTAFRY